MNITMEEIKKLREETGAGVMDAKRALEESKGDVDKAKGWITKKGMARAEKKADRETGVVRVYSYIHHNGSMGSLASISCETDFVAKTDEFEKLGNEIAMQVASTDPKDVSELMNQDYIRDTSKTIEQLVKETSGSIGENIVISDFRRL